MIDGRKHIVSDLLGRGDDTVDAFCLSCGKTWEMPIGFLPAATTLEKIETLAICPTCGGRDIDIDTIGPRTALTH
jgi:hypothetical protein